MKLGCIDEQVYFQFVHSYSIEYTPKTYKILEMETLCSEIISILKQ